MAISATKGGTLIFEVIIERSKYRIDGRVRVEVS
jgi:hypothetical protein